MQWPVGPPTFGPDHASEVVGSWPILDRVEIDSYVSITDLWVNIRKGKTQNFARIIRDHSPHP